MSQIYTNRVESQGFFTDNKVSKETQTPMEQWLTAFSHFLDLDTLMNRWTYSLYTMCVLAGVLAVELYFTGWKNSSLGRISEFTRTGLWDFTSFVFTVTGIQKILTNAFLLGLIGYLVVLTRNYNLPVLQEAPYWLRLTLAIILFDFLGYWSHRLRHEWDWLWITHEYHHSSTKLNALSAFRVHPLEYLSFYTNTVLVLKIFFPGEVDLGFFAWIGVANGFISHSRIDTDLGFIGKYIIVSPRFHHKHHLPGEECFTNYGVFFVFWDRIFGTYSAPDTSIEQMNVGLNHNPYEDSHPVHAFLKPVMDFYTYPFRKFKSLHAVRAKRKI